ncbi:hypothetical protein [Ornithinimicrobium sp. INDO-MA30-4]|uniref:hypothetical protein n=1 Tax=Ornithinimicrobium sp. INDO-MA30-4 TaxID=2908651 RepID=UPI001F16843A|nr:hypothetical protein [Ornithinimicrobium sp. INDO-MA30-4]UJH70443.1 hypothetical protein L0A91_15245 [Ornithinimicrobium sp. INDO-MA30-4]
MSDFGCSVCGQLVEDCDHQMGEFYSKQIHRDDEGACSLCGAINCEHTEGETHSVEAYAEARNVKAREVSFVARPRYPQARIVEMEQEMGLAGQDPRFRVLRSEATSIAMRIWVRAEVSMK